MQDTRPGVTGTLTETTTDLQEPEEGDRVEVVVEVISPGTTAQEVGELRALAVQGTALRETVEELVEVVEVEVEGVEYPDVITGFTGVLVTG